MASSKGVRGWLYVCLCACGCWIHVCTYLCAYAFDCLDMCIGTCVHMNKRDNVFFSPGSGLLRIRIFISGGFSLKNLS